MRLLRTIADNRLLKPGEIIMIFNPSEKGQGLIEYALILVLVAIVVIVILSALGTQVNSALNTVNSALEQ